MGDTTWTIVNAIASSLMAIVTALMAYATFRTNKISKKQISEQKRQWEESNRPRLIFSIYSDTQFYILKIENIGLETAYNIRIKINEDFIDTIHFEEIVDILKSVMSKSLVIPPKGALYYILCPTENRVSFRKYDSTFISLNVPPILSHNINISATYNDIYTYNESFKIKDFIGSLYIPNIEESLYAINEDIEYLGNVINRKY